MTRKPPEQMRRNFELIRALLHEPGRTSAELRAIEPLVSRSTLYRGFNLLRSLGFKIEVCGFEPGRVGIYSNTQLYRIPPGGFPGWLRRGLRRGARP